MYDRINFFVELDISKAKKNSNTIIEDKYDNMILEGLASDNSTDDEGEIMEPGGFILDRFLKFGLINLDHLPTRSPINKTRFWIGEPLEAKINKGKFWLKCKLWKKSPEARAFYDKALEMQESGSTRKPGFSIEGKALERDPMNPKRVTKLLITNVALTMCPVNSNSYADIVKGRQSQDYIEHEFECGNNQSIILLDYEVDGYKITVNKSFQVSTTKLEQSPALAEKLEQLYNKGHISQRVYNDFVKKIGQ